MQRLRDFAVLTIILALVALPAVTSSKNQEDAPVLPATPQNTKFVKKLNAIPNRYIVVLNDDVANDQNSREVRLKNVTEIANSHAELNLGKVDYVYETALKGYAIELPDEAAAIAISENPEVKWVEEDHNLIPLQTQVSPQPTPPWGLDAIDGNIPAPTPNATGRTNGSYIFHGDGAGVNAYVIDSGINTAHVDFGTPVSRATQAADCIRNNDCRTGPPSPFSDAACGIGGPNTSNNDCMGHGTHVAAILGGNTYGVAKGVNIRSVKVCVVTGGLIPVDCPASAVIQGVNWVTSQHLADSSVPKLVNISLGYPDGLPFNPPFFNNSGIDSAVSFSIGRGVTYVIAAGNSNRDARTFHPAVVEPALTVGAVDWNANRPDFSNYGPGIDLFAPGVDVVSAQTGVGGLGDCAFWNGTNTDECRQSGTSMAAPHVAGAVAIYLQNRTGLSNCVFPINGPAPPIGANLSTCPDRIVRYLKANSNLDRLTNTIHGILREANGTPILDPLGNTIPVLSPNRFLWSVTVPTAPNPLESHRFFVWTHYADFLNREPDHGGLNFWTNEINSCAGNAQCIEVKRINVSAAFFLSIEYQQTGFLAYRFYNAALNRANGLPRFQELVNDTQAIGNGVVVGVPGWEAQLEANKVAYANGFVSRSEFTALYPTSLTPTQFVDALYAHAVITPTAQERQAAIDEFNTPNGARGRVLRRVAENQTLKDREFNRAFVLMQYFGYLRRNPDDPPDNNMNGYNFWLNKLNQFNGNFVQAEMVKGFITSSEYRRRFGP